MLKQNHLVRIIFCDCDQFLGDSIEHRKITTHSMNFGKYILLYTYSYVDRTQASAFPRCPTQPLLTTFILAPALTKRLPYARFMDSTPAINWDRIVNDHFVQWYDNDDSLIRLVGEFISRDLSRQNAAIIVTTPSHRAGIEKFLDSRNLNVEVLRRSGRYIPLDA